MATYFYSLIVGLILVAIVYKYFIADKLNEAFIFDTNTDVGEPYDYCDKHPTCALVAPNIPVAGQVAHKSCGKYCGSLRGQNLAPREGCYKFPIPRFLYDGIWEDKREFPDNGQVEIKEWNLIPKTGEKCCNPSESHYATNKFFHLPEKCWPPVEDSDAFYMGDARVKLQQQNRTNLRQPGATGLEIHYWPAGVCGNEPVYP